MSGLERSERARRKDAGKPRPYRCRPIKDRILEKVEQDENGCWIWQASSLKSRSGQDSRYGQFWFNGTTGLAHRAAYEEWVGPIPEGFAIDHLCGVTLCCNPAHLEAVTHRENLMRSAKTWVGQNTRKTHCPHGHEYTPENTGQMVSKGRMAKAYTSRICLTCHPNRRKKAA